MAGRKKKNGNGMKNGGGKKQTTGMSHLRNLATNRNARKQLMALEQDAMRQSPPPRRGRKKR